MWRNTSGKRRQIFQEYISFSHELEPGWTLTWRQGGGRERTCTYSNAHLCLLVQTYGSLVCSSCPGLKRGCTLRCWGGGGYCMWSVHESGGNVWPNWRGHSFQRLATSKCWKHCASPMQVLTGWALSAVMIALAEMYWQLTKCQAPLSLGPFYTWGNWGKGKGSYVPSNHAANKGQSWDLDQAVCSEVCTIKPPVLKATPVDRLWPLSWRSVEADSPRRNQNLSGGLRTNIIYYPKWDVSENKKWHA